MDRGLSTGTQAGDEGLRERNVPSQSPPKLTTEALTATGDIKPKDQPGQDLKTFGRTPDGTGRSCVWLDCTPINLLISSRPSNAPQFEKANSPVINA